MRPYVFFASLFGFLLLAHLLHSHVLWAEETLPLAAAMQMKAGAVLYRDIWFDKPPLVPAIYLLWGAPSGPLLRLAGAVYVLIVCVCAWAAAGRMWSRAEAYVAAALAAFFLTFDIHSAVLPLAADLLLIGPHCAAICFAWRKRPFWCGVMAGVGFLFNAKAVFVLAACALFLLSIKELLQLAAGFAAVNAMALGWIAASGAWSAYVEQVWRWPSLYAASPMETRPVWNGMVRTANWLGFHAALVIGTCFFLCRNRNWRVTWKMMAWIAVSYAGVALGWRFFPRYFFLLLSPMIFCAARGLVVARSRLLLAVTALALIIPAARFGPRYFALENWNDLALDRDSREASERIAELKGRTLFVWGYRPEIFVYTGLRPATKYLESQAMTGVPADRHLAQSTVVLTRGTEGARAELAASRPDIVVDGLSLFNPALAMQNYRDNNTSKAI